MAKTTFYYNNLRKMPPKPGSSFSTTYIDQETKERQLMSETLLRHCQTLCEYANKHPNVDQAFKEPVEKMKKKTNGEKRTYYEVIEDMVGECLGKTNKGDPKDFAQAPIERWNHAFPDFEIELQRGIRPKNNAGQLFKGL